MTKLAKVTIKKLEYLLFFWFEIIFQTSNKCHYIIIIIFLTQFTDVRLIHSHEWIDLFFITCN